MTVTPSATPTRPEATPLADGGLLDEAQVYNTMWHSSQGKFGPREVDELYLWEIGTLLGRAEEITTQDSQDAKTSKSMPKPEDFQRRSRAHLHARLAHAQGKGPKPEARPIDPDTLASLSEAMNGST